jgi:hypothetical protein
MNRQKLVLTVFIGLFLCSLVYAFWRMPRQKTVEKLKYVSGMAAESSRIKQNKDAEGVRLRLDLLEAKKGRSFSGGKNIFLGFYSETPKKLLIPLPLPPPPPEKKPVPVEVKPLLPVVAEPTPMQKEMATFTFLGFIKNENRKTIFLSNGKEIFLVKKGDKIAGKYEVTSLTEETLTVAAIADGGEVLIPLVENKPLVSPRK